MFGTSHGDDEPDESNGVNGANSPISPPDRGREGYWGVSKEADDGTPVIEVSFHDAVVPDEVQTPDDFEDWVRSFFMHYLKKQAKDRLLGGVL